ncbi:hypothetical protein CEXT_628051 [Caerostris extrusa]|uniref:Uncharacterized protein n=1 Tax=Caerostris extrusa TaxID=172846 RepID=A0AAV4UQ61_CAEEX|nr:hypothetical protein CEXT_628051 [Caerostris extrusa]
MVSSKRSLPSRLARHTDRIYRGPPSFIYFAASSFLLRPPLSDGGQCRGNAGQMDRDGRNLRLNDPLRNPRWKRRHHGAWDFTSIGE